MFFHLISKRQSLDIGLAYFFTGKPCVNGGVWLRKTKTGVCECANCKAKRLAKQGEWVKQNRDHLNEKARIYASKPDVKKRQAERDRKRLENNREEMNRKKREWYHENKERAKAKRSEWIDRIGHEAYKAYAKKHGRKRYEKHKIKIVSQVIEWRKRNPEKTSMYARATAAKRRSAEGRYTSADVERLMAMQKGRCAYCAGSIIDSYHIDHVMPLALGGTNWPDNLQLLCPPCNLAKGAKHPVDFAQTQGLLL